MGLLGIQEVAISVDYEVASWYLDQNRLKQTMFVIKIRVHTEDSWIVWICEENGLEKPQLKIAKKWS